MRAVDTLNLLARETVALGQDPLALISAGELVTELSMLRNFDIPFTPQ